MAETEAWCSFLNSNMTKFWINTLKTRPSKGHAVKQKQEFRKIVNETDEVQCRIELEYFSQFWQTKNTLRTSAKFVLTCSLTRKSCKNFWLPTNSCGLSPSLLFWFGAKGFLLVSETQVAATTAFFFQDVPKAQKNRWPTCVLSQKVSPCVLYSSNKESSISSWHLAQYLKEKTTAHNKFIQ